MEFIGYRPAGSTVTEQFVTDGIIDGTGPGVDFETFYFDSRFADLVKLELLGYGSALDNFVFRNIPEPSTAVLLLAGALLLGTIASRRRRNGSGQRDGLS